MWLVLPRQPLPDKAYWPGRRILAIFDALFWPAVLTVALAHCPGNGGIARPLATVLAFLFALARLRTAWSRNHRYRFVTWWLARALLFLVLVAALLKFAMTI